MAPSNIAEVASAREIENGSLPLSLPHYFFLSLSRPSPVIMLASRRLIIAT